MKNANNPPTADEKIAGSTQHCNPDMTDSAEAGGRAPLHQPADMEEAVRALLRDIQKQPDPEKTLRWYVLALDGLGKGDRAFHRISAAARVSERQRDFVFAAALWALAYENAHKEVNREWARKRSEQCQVLERYQMSYGRQKLPYCYICRERTVGFCG